MNKFAFIAGCSILMAGLLSQASAQPSMAGGEPQRKLAYATAWEESKSDDAFGAFQVWAGKFSAAANAGSRAQMLSEGVRLARERRAALAQLIKTNPQRALDQAVPSVVRDQLPAQVVAHLESRVSGIGDLSVRAYLAAKGGPAVQPIERLVTLDGQTYRAYVYGRRVGQTSKKEIPLHGIVIDGMLALHEGALRELESAEKPAPGKTVRELGEPASSGARIRAELGRKIYLFGSRQELLQAETKLEAAESGLNPHPQRSAEAILEPASQPAAPPDAGAGPGRNPPSAWTTGLKNILIIRVDFSDLPGDPVGGNDTSPPSNNNTVYTQGYVQNIADTRISPYYLKSSYGLTSTSNTVTALYRMPQTANNYATTPTGNDQLHTDAEAAASAAYNLQNFDRIMVLFSFLGNIPGSFITYGGLAEIVGKKVWVNGEFDTRVTTHELGHTYGLYHAGLWDVTDGNPISPNGTVIEYGDDFDTMGANFANDPNTDFNPFYKNQLGWISDSQVLTVPPVGGIFRVFAFDWSNYLVATNHPILALRYTKDGQRDYWIGVRRNFTGNPYMGNGAYIMWGFATPGAGGGGGFQSALLDMTTPGGSPGAGLANDYDAALAIGITFSDPPAGFSVRPLDEGGTLPDGFLDLQLNGGGAASLQIATNYLTGGNGNGIIDFDECNNLFLVLTNVGATGATNVAVSISTTNAGVILAGRSSSYPDIPAGASGTNLTAFRISTKPDFVCGFPIVLSVVIKSDQVTSTNRLVLSSGTNATPIRFDSTGPVAIPDNNAAGTNSSITVSNITGAIGAITVSVFITHTFDSDLTLQLIGPDGTIDTLSANHGSFGNNYGVGCSPEANRTTFDDAATNSIGSGNPPFIGSFRPDEPLSVFVGKAGTNVNGVWKLHVIDSEALDVGTIQCWSLLLSPAGCLDGGGQCPGADLAIGMAAAPEPVFLGSNLVYTITVTNFGPSIAKNAVISQVLPNSVVFVSASIVPPAPISQAGGVVTANLGNFNPDGTATATVIVTPAATGLISSSASISSSELDFDTSNNSVTVVSHVNPPFADLAVGLLDNPDPVLVGGTLTYSLSVTNKGPSLASGVVVSNVLPSSVGIVAVNPSQGFYNIYGNVVVCSFGNLVNGARATATIDVVPNLEGTISATASATANQTDPVPGNSSATASTVVGPASDLALGLVDAPDPVVVSSNLTYTINVTNRGPSVATSVVVSGNFPYNVTVLSNYTTLGTNSISGSALTCNIATMTNGARATITVLVAAPATNGVLSASAAVVSAQTDPLPANNGASVTTVVSNRVISIVAAGATLTSESFSPPNGGIDSGETVTLQLRLQNVGNVVPNTNIVATLQTNGGFTPLSGPRSYGLLKPLGLGGFPVGQPFSATVTGGNGATVTASLQLQMGVTNLGIVTFNFLLPNQTNFANTAAITIPDSGTATPYPSVITVSGLTGLVSKATVTLSNFSHTFPHDVSVLLVGPTGAKTMLMSHAADGSSLSHADLTFDDSAAAPLPASGQIFSGSWQPGAYSPPTLPPPAPGGIAPTALSAFNSTAPNGDWSLYVFDDTEGDQGTIAGGWSLALTVVTPINQTADLGLTASASPNPVLVGDYLTNVFTVANLGPNNASGVSFTNRLPAGASYFSVSSSQGTPVFNGSSVVCNLGSLGSGAGATLTLVTTVNAAGSLTNSANVAANEIDLNQANNAVASVATANLPLADVAISAGATPDPVVLTNNLTYVLTVTNNGPNNALNVVVTDAAPAGSAFTSTGASQGTSTNLGGTNIVAALGTIVAGGSATVTNVLVPSIPGQLTNVAVVTTASSDGTSANNSATTITTVAVPAPHILPAGARIIFENLAQNATVDPGETVTLSLSLTNAGSAPTTNLVATLLSSADVTQPSGAQSYGVIANGGGAVAMNFSFTAGAGSGGLIVATLQLHDGAADLGTASFTFSLPVTGSFSSASAITIPDHGQAVPYPSTITVSGLTGLVSKVTVTLNGVTHAFPDDLDILLVSPSGQKVVVMSDAGGGHPISNLTLTFDDDAGALLPDSAQIVSGTFKPTDYEPGDIFPPPAPAGAVAPVLSACNGTSGNGTWSLYVMDDSNGDGGSISGGWSLAITTVNAVNAIADLGVIMSDAPDPLYTGTTLTYTIVLTNRGPANASSVVLTDPLPFGFTLVHSNASQGTISSSSAAIGNTVVTWTLSGLNSGAGATATLQVVPSYGGTVTNAATVTLSNESDLNLINNVALTSTTILVAQPVHLSIAPAGIQFEVTLTGEAGQVYVLEATTNFTSWTHLFTNTAPANGIIKFTTTDSQNFRGRYYRAFRVP